MNEKIQQAIALLREAQDEVPQWGAAFYACARAIKDLNEYAQDPS
jgi:hypothetical protein